MGISSQIQKLRRNTSASPVVLAALLAVALWANTSWAGASEPAKWHNTTDARFRTLTGATLELSEYTGKPVLLSFWSTSCVICLEDIPRLKQLYQALQDQDVEMISVTMPYDPPNHVVDVTAHYSLPYPVAIDLDGSLMRLFDIPGTPTLVLISQQGEVSQTFVGPLDYQKTLDAVTRLL